MPLAAPQTANDAFERACMTSAHLPLDTSHYNETVTFVRNIDLFFQKSTHPQILAFSKIINDLALIHTGSKPTPKPTPNEDRPPSPASYIHAVFSTHPARTRPQIPPANKETIEEVVDITQGSRPRTASLDQSKKRKRHDSPSHHPDVDNEQSNTESPPASKQAKTAQDKAQNVKSRIRTIDNKATTKEKPENREIVGERGNARAGLALVASPVTPDWSRPNNAASTSTGLETVPALGIRKAAINRKLLLAAPQFVFPMEADESTIISLRNSFFKGLSELKIEKTQGKGKSSFSKAEAIEITNFFFAEVLGPPATKRLKSIITEFNTPSTSWFGARPSAKALELSTDTTIFPAFRQFFDAVHKTERLGTSSNSALNHVHMLLANVKLVRRYQELRNRADQEDPELIAHLVSLGYSLRKGAGWTTCVLDYLSKSLGMDRDVLERSTQSSQAVELIVSLFGTGIIAVLPPGITTKLRKWGLQRVKGAVTLLHELAPIIKPIAVFLQQGVIEPLVSGGDIPMMLLDGISAAPNQRTMGRVLSRESTSSPFPETVSLPMIT